MIVSSNTGEKMISNLKGFLFNSNKDWIDKEIIFCSKFCKVKQINMKELVLSTQQLQQ